MVNRLRSMCQQIVDNGGTPPESPTFPLSIPREFQGNCSYWSCGIRPTELIVNRRSFPILESSIVIERATKMLEFVLPSAAGCE